MTKKKTIDHNNKNSLNKLEDSVLFRAWVVNKINEYS